MPKPRDMSRDAVIARMLKNAPKSFTPKAKKKLSPAAKVKKRTKRGKEDQALLDDLDKGPLDA
jgi:hypothetical protein